MNFFTFSVMKPEINNNKFHCKAVNWQEHSYLQNLPKFLITENFFDLEVNFDGPEITFWALLEDLGSLREIVSRSSVQMSIA